MKRCTECLIPDTRPDTAFVDGVCSACLTFKNRPRINWEEREQALRDLLRRHDNRCIVPSSGGKDSTYQVIKLLEYGADVTVVTARTCMLTGIGRRNIDNLARYARTIEYVPNMKVRAKLNKLGLTMVGDISWPEHVAIFTTPFRAAEQLGIPLLFYGENPQNQYGGPLGTEGAQQMTQRWVSEFGGFLGLRADDMVGIEGITERDMDDYRLPVRSMKDATTYGGIEAHFLGQYLPWDSLENAVISQQHGMECPAEPPSPANFWYFENLDNAMTGLHDHMMYRKYGYGRLAAQLSVEIRLGNLDRETALELALERDGLFPYKYMGVDIDQVAEAMGMKINEVVDVCDQFTNWALFDGVKFNRPILRA